jgi:DNA-binding NarL/FixJ family response regulator
MRRDGIKSMLVLVRAAGEPDFAPRARAIVRELHSQVAPLIEGPLAGYQDPSPDGLSPRARQVLRSLLEGDGDKQAAARLGLSRHTVNFYVRRIFGHFGVAARAELMACWTRRGWGLPVENPEATSRTY